MITPNRGAVIRNIQKELVAGNYNAKVEVDDPVYTKEMREEVLVRYLRMRETTLFKLYNRAAGRMLDLITWIQNNDTRIIGFEKLKEIRQMKQGAIITSNHFNPVENTAIRLLSQKMKRGKLYIVSQDTNLAMKGIFGFFMNYVDVIPISKDMDYMKNHFDYLLHEALFKKGQNVLIYPEEEMWFNYRKPRPPKRGAYYYAAKHGVPVIPCFMEIRELQKMERACFHKVRYILHVLEPIFPDPDLSVRQNSLWMAKTDYRQKIEAYENAYHKKMTYDFSVWDIAGWTGEYDADKSGDALSDNSLDKPVSL